jgi:pyruvate formate lyase activating enzyme
MSAAEVMAEVMRDRQFYELSGGGVTLSGGEPLHQPEFCLEVVQAAKSAGLHVAVDTSGAVAFAACLRVLPFVDLFLYDLKFINKFAHQKYTGQENGLILDNFRRLCQTDKTIVVRVPLIPGITDVKKNLGEIKSFVEGCRGGLAIEYVPYNVLIQEKYRMMGKTCR